MRFIDEARVFVHAGKGGDGAIAFLRDFKYQPRLIAKDGEDGRGKEQYGHGADDVVVRVPPGTIVFDEESGMTLADLVMPGDTATIAQGGEGGRGNMHFASSTRRSPRIATPGTAGEQRWIRMELRLVAEAGLVGLPNAGKSTLLAALSAARPKIASYPFTTLAPNIGRVSISGKESFTLTDIPGLIEGAHRGLGLGIRFLRHLARTRLIVYVLDGADDPDAAFATVRAEIAAFDPVLADRPAVVALNKIDLIGADEVNKTARKLRKLTGLEVFPISADKSENLAPLVAAIARMLHRMDQPAACPS